MCALTSSPAYTAIYYLIFNYALVCDGLPADHVPVTVNGVIFGWHVVVVRGTAVAVTEDFEL